MSPHNRLLMLVPRYAPAIGGVEKHVEMLSKKLMTSGFQITILTCKHQKALPSYERKGDFQIIRFPYLWDKNPFLTYLWMFMNRRKLLSNDIIHIHDTMPFLLWYLPLRLLYPTKSIYVTFHGYERDPVPVIFILMRKLARFLARRSLCIGTFIEGIYDVRCNASSVGATETRELRNQPREGAVYIGRLERDVGIEAYMEAIFILEKNRGIRMNLTLCGTGSIEGDLKELADSLDIDAQFMGVVDNPFDILISKYVCFAGGYLSILEANAAGTPVIAISKSQLKQQYYKSMREASGLLSIQTTSEGIANEISRLRENPRVFKIISEAGREFAKSMTWKKMLQQYGELWGFRINQTTGHKEFQ